MDGTVNCAKREDGRPALAGVGVATGAAGAGVDLTGEELTDIDFFSFTTTAGADEVAFAFAAGLAGALTGVGDLAADFGGAFATVLPADLGVGEIDFTGFIATGTLTGALAAAFTGAFATGLAAALTTGLAATFVAGLTSAFGAGLAAAFAVALGAAGAAALGAALLAAAGLADAAVALVFLPV